MTPLLTIDAVAEQLNVHHGLVRRLILSGKLVGSKVGGVWRVRQQDIDAFLERSRPQVARPVLAEKLPAVRVRRFS